MQMRTLFVLALMFLAAGSIQAEDWYPSKYGAEDRLGAVANLSPEKVVQAASLIREGKTYRLGVVTGRNTPAWGTRTYSMTTIPIGDGSGSTLGKNNGTGNDDLLSTWNGIGSQIDGLGHLGINHRYYNGVHVSEFLQPDGLTQFGVHELPPIATRGVLLDVAAHRGVPMLPAGAAVNQEEIEAIAKKQGVTIGKGDVVLLHTGWLAMADSDPKAFLAGEPGLGKGGARYLAGLGVVAVGADSWGTEAMPFEDPEEMYPVHQILLAKHGVYNLENMDTRELAADQAYEFFFVLGVARFEGAVQAVINPVAIR